ncbi:MAG: hypothetical protein SFU98_19255 [Leptospiraceae bacterium]|nr:hypothetical protein [Leptospiraceae bacterium]
MHFVIQSYQKISKLCAFEVYESVGNCESFHVPFHNESCADLGLEEPLFSLSDKDATSSILKPMAEFGLEYPKSSYKKQSISVINFDPNPKKQFSKDLISSFQKKEIEFTNTILNDETKINYLKSAINKLFPKAKSSLVLLSEPNFELLADLDKVQTSYKDSILFQTNNGFESLYDANEDNKIQFSSCRQSLSVIFKNNKKPEEIYYVCKNFVLERLAQTTKKEIATESELFVFGDIWQSIEKIYNTNKLTISMLEKNLPIHCKLSADELYKKGFSKKNAIRLCYTISYASALMEYTDKTTLTILPEYSLAFSASKDKNHFNSCNNSSTSNNTIPKK